MAQPHGKVGMKSAIINKNLIMVKLYFVWLRVAILVFNPHPQ